MPYVRISVEHDLERIKQAILDPRVKEIDGSKVTSLRMKTFANSGWSCASCGLVALFFAREHQDHPSQPDKIHWNLYGTRGEAEVLFTHDHIKPRSKGGENALHNTQTMCSPCNAEKADTWTSPTP